MARTSDAYRDLVDHLPDGFARHQMVLDADGKPVDYVFLDVNPVFEALTGLTREQLIGSRVTEALPGIERSSFDWIGVYGRVAQGGPSASFEQYSEPLGRWYEVTVYSDEPGHFTTIFHDITARRDIEYALREGEARYRSLFEHSMDAIYIGTPDGSVVDVNQAWLDLFGYTRNDLPVLRAEDFYANPSDRDDFTRRMAKTGFVQDVVRYKRKDGTTFDCQRSQVALRNQSGTIVAFQGINRDVSQLRRAEEALRESEQRFRSLFEQSLDAIYVATPDGSSLAANQAWLDLFGYTREELPQISVLSIYADPAEREGFLRRIGETGFIKDEVRYKRKDGSEFDAERTVVALKDPSGKVLAYQGVNRDITERKRAEQALRTSEERLAQLARHGRVVAWEVDTDGLFTYVSPVATEVLGFRPEELVGMKHFYDVPVDAAREEVKTLGLAAIHDGKEVTDVDCPLMTADTRVLWSVISGVPLMDTDGKTIGLRGWMVDNSARKQAEMALRESEQKYRELFHHSMDAISLVSPGGLLLEANQAYLDLFGYTKEDIGILNVEEHYVNPEDRLQLIEAIAERGELVDDEVRLRKRNGSVMDCVRTVVVRRDMHGNVIGDQSVIRDVTESKRAERNLRESEQQYRQLFEQSMDAIYLGTPQGRIIDVNRAWLRLFGYSRKDLPVLTALDLYADPSERETFLRKMMKRDHVIDEVHFRKKDGTVFECERSVAARRGIRGVPVAYQGIFRDVTERNRARAELERLARFDMLTGVLNRRSILDKLTEWVIHTRRYGGSLSAVMVDIDHFKQVNDRYGHQVGDHVLTDTASLLRRSVRTTDFVGRYGGEEFLIVLPKTDAAGAAVVAERTRAHLQGTTMHDAAGGIFGVTASFGVAQWCDENEDALVGRADQALYAAKAAGRNCVKVSACLGDAETKQPRDA